MTGVWGTISCVRRRITPKNRTQTILLFIIAKFHIFFKRITQVCWYIYNSIVQQKREMVNKGEFNVPKTRKSKKIGEITWHFALLIIYFYLARFRHFYILKSAASLILVLVLAHGERKRCPYWGQFERGNDSGEKNLSAEKAPAEKRARFQKENGHEEWP